jgi:soluble lytic murein transglycosylase-like protein
MQDLGWWIAGGITTVAVVDFMLLPSFSNPGAAAQQLQLQALAWCFGRLLGVDPTLVMAVMNNEVGTDGSTLGDVGISGGPSVGPMQVLYATAIRYGFIASSETTDTYQQRANDWVTGTFWGVKILAAALAQASGNVASAFSIYNSGSAGNTGSGSYSDRAIQWLTSVGYDTAQSAA